MVTLEWDGEMGFEAHPPSGNKFVIDSHPDFGGKNKGPTPLEAFLAAVGACSAVDVIAILQKKQQKVTAYRVEVEGLGRPPQNEYPRPFKSIVIRHVVKGENIDPAALQRAVELSDGKYCSVIATLRTTPAVSSEWKIEK